MYVQFSYVSYVSYVLNSVTLIQVATWFSCGKMGVQGPLAWALIVWRCSLVFSSVDKIVSVLIHLLPGVYMIFTKSLMVNLCHSQVVLGSLMRSF